MAYNFEAGVKELFAHGVHCCLYCCLHCGIDFRANLVGEAREQGIVGLRRGGSGGGVVGMCMLALLCGPNRRGLLHGGRGLRGLGVGGCCLGLALAFGIGLGLLVLTVVAVGLGLALAGGAGAARRCLRAVNRDDNRYECERPARNFTRGLASSARAAVASSAKTTRAEPGSTRVLGSGALA